MSGFFKNCVEIKPKYGPGQQVTVDFMGNKPFTVKSSKWTGRTFMYSFEENDARTAEDYIKKA